MELEFWQKVNNAVSNGYELYNRLGCWDSEEYNLKQFCHEKFSGKGTLWKHKMVVSKWDLDKYEVMVTQEKDWKHQNLSGVRAWHIWRISNKLESLEPSECGGEWWESSEEGVS